jgi:hypothetical protein
MFTDNIPCCTNRTAERRYNVCVMYRSVASFGCAPAGIKMRAFEKVVKEKNIYADN